MKRGLCIVWLLGIVCLISGCVSVKSSEVQSQDQEPSEVIRIWNDALYDGDIELARKHTSKTSFEYFRSTVGWFEGLVQLYQKTKNNRPRCVADNQTIKGSTARVVYTCFYPDNSIKQYEDILFFEEGIWKVAPQFVRVTNK